MKKNNTASSTFWRSGCTRRGSADDENTETDQGHAKPAHWGDHFTKKEVTEHRDGEIRQGSSGLHVTVIRPGQQQHVNDEKRKEASYSQPDIARRQHATGDRDKV
jgi:hypothetical protein